MSEIKWTGTWTTRCCSRPITPRPRNSITWTERRVREGRGFCSERTTYALSNTHRPADRTLKALLRGDGGVHPAVLHDAVRRTEAEIVHMIGNIEPAMDDARRNDQDVTDLQLDFACTDRHATAAARTVRSAVGVVRAVPAVEKLAIDERRAAAGDDVIAFGLIVMRDGALKCVRRRIGTLFSTRDRRGRCLRPPPAAAWVPRAG